MSHSHHQTFPKDKKGQPNVSEEKPKKDEVGKTEDPVVTIEQMKSFVTETEKNLKELFAEQANCCSKGDLQNPDKNQSNHDIDKGAQSSNGKHTSILKVDH